MSHRFQHILHRWHRRVGIVAALFVLLLAISGLLLSHAAALKLDKRTFSASWLVRWYGLNPKTAPRAHASAAGHLVWIDGGLYLDRTPIDPHFSALIGVGETAELIAVAGADMILLLDRQGTRIERLDRASLPEQLTAIGVDEQGRIAVRGADNIYVSADLLAWSPLASTDAVRWSTVEVDPEPATIAPSIAAFRGQGVSAARLITDLHTGRFLGPIGPWLMDASAIVLIVLAGSGVWMWTRRKRSQNQPRE